MKIGCDACGRAAAAVLCCADEAALCRGCDAAVHSANRLAGRHQRLHLLSSSSSAGAGEGDGGTHPACDICQDKTGYFFCVEDRALLCRSCDVAVHTATPQASSHRRFLITGVRVGANAQQDHHNASPSRSSANGSSSVNVPPASSSRSLQANVAHDDRRSAQAAARLLGVGGEDDDEEEAAAAQQQWWSDIFGTDDDEGRQCYDGLLSEPAGSSGLTG